MVNLDNMKKLREVVPKQLDTHFLKSLEGFGTSENYDKEKLSLNCYFEHWFYDQAEGIGSSKCFYIGLKSNFPKF